MLLQSPLNPPVVQSRKYLAHEGEIRLIRPHYLAFGIHQTYVLARQSQVATRLQANMQIEHVNTLREINNLQHQSQDNHSKCNFPRKSPQSLKK
jgi:hypothetical protein